MSLPYCPNCRHEIGEDALGWICWNTFRARADAKDDIREQAMDAYGQETEYRGEREDVLCGCYNPPGTDTCASAECGAPKSPGRFLQACPYCRMDVPEIENCSTQTITISGPPGAGKTHYIIALHDWWERHLPRFGPMIEPAMGRRLRKRFSALRKLVIEQKTVVEANLPGEMISFSWRIPPSDDGQPGMLLTFPDGSGERQLDAEALHVNRHYHHTTGIILVLDGERIAVSQGIDYETARDPYQHTMLINAMLIDLNKRLTPAERSAIPIAVCINKVDILVSREERWKQVMNTFQPRHEGFFDHATCDQASDAIRELLLSYPDTATIVYKIERNFVNRMFFAMSTIGSEVRDGLKGNSIVFLPQRVSDPFLWMLWFLRVIE